MRVFNTRKRTTHIVKRCDKGCDDMMCAAMMKLKETSEGTAENTENLQGLHNSVWKTNTTVCAGQMTGTRARWLALSKKKKNQTYCD